MFGPLASSQENAAILAITKLVLEISALQGK